MYKIVLLSEKKFESAAQLEAQQILKAIFRITTSAMFQNKKLSTMQLLQLPSLQKLRFALCPLLQLVIFMTKQKSLGQIFKLIIIYC